MPFAILLMISAVAGATTMTSAQSSNAIWPLLYSSGVLHILVKTAEPVTPSKLFGLINRQAFSVIIVFTLAPAAVSELAKSTALYAAIPPLTPKQDVGPDFPNHRKIGPRFCFRRKLRGRLSKFASFLSIAGLFG